MPFWLGLSNSSNSSSNSYFGGKFLSRKVRVGWNLSWENTNALPILFAGFFKSFFYVSTYAVKFVGKMPNGTGLRLKQGPSASLWPGEIKDEHRHSFSPPFSPQYCLGPLGPLPLHSQPPTGRNIPRSKKATTQVKIYSPVASLSICYNKMQIGAGQDRNLQD
jgi:hypothetical protein